MRCLMDRDDSGRKAVMAAGNQWYGFNYAVNGYGVNNTLKGVASSGAANPGVYSMQKTWKYSQSSKQTHALGRGCFS